MDVVDKIWQDSKKDNVGLFIENRLKVSKKVSWTAGLRADRTSYQINDPADDFKAQYNNYIQREAGHFDS
jgi:iron complex outermembrane receptor protein